VGAVNTIERVLDARVLAPELVIVPHRGATDEEITAEQLKLGRPLQPDHVAILRRWNGIALEMIRFFGCCSANKVGRLSDLQNKLVPAIDAGVLVGSDASGFVYIQLDDGRVMCYDADGSVATEIATSLDDFIERVVFGRDAASFAGAEWLEELRRSGIVS
jgi:hypothetical protein